MKALLRLYEGSIKAMLRPVRLRPSEEASDIYAVQKALTGSVQRLNIRVT
jgi:hypothetical protein